MSSGPSPSSPMDPSSSDDDDNRSPLSSSVVSPLVLLIPLLALFQAAVPYMVKKLVSLSVSVGEDERRLLREIQTLREEQRSISMMDEFAKHAKMERRILKLKEEIQTHGTMRATERSKASTAFYVTLYSVLALLFLFLMVTYGGEPLVVLNPNWLYPLGWIFSFPSWISGAVGLPFWAFSSKSFIKSVQQAFTS